MKQIRCDGTCGLMEPVNLEKDRRKIKPVKLTVIHDTRDSFPEGKRTFEADLCDDCEGMLLHNYFGVRAEGSLELPAFAEPAPISQMAAMR